MTHASTKERLVAALLEVSKMHPDMRFGQLVSNVALWARGPTVEAVWDVEDEELLEAAEAHLHPKVSNAG